jgi:hypothetical protein
MHGIPFRKKSAILPESLIRQEYSHQGELTRCGTMARPATRLSAQCNPEITLLIKRRREKPVGRALPGNLG